LHIIEALIILTLEDKKMKSCIPSRLSARKKKRRCSACHQRWVKEEHVLTGLCAVCLQESTNVEKKKKNCSKCKRQWVKDKSTSTGLCVNCLAVSMNEEISVQSKSDSTESCGLYDTDTDLSNESRSVRNNKQSCSVPNIDENISDKSDSDSTDLESDGLNDADKDFSDEINDTDNDFSETPNDLCASEHTEYLSCINCKRSVENMNALDTTTDESGPFEQYMTLIFQWIPLEEVHMKYKWCLFKKEEADGDHVLMCTHCANVCCEKDLKSNFLFAWPSFIWNVLKNTEAQATFGKELWQLIPIRWRVWWFHAIKKFDCFHEVTMLQPEPHVAEVSQEIQEISDAMRHLKALNLFKVMDKHILIPKVKCPWGCVQFLNLASAHVPLDQIFLEFLDYPSEMLTLSSHKYPRWIEGIRPNFIRSKHYIAGKDFGSCMPSIAFDKLKGPVFLTCGDHSIQSKGQYIHPPPSPFGWIASPASDQFAPAVMKPRTVQSVKRRKYSDCYHTVQMKGSYEGIDTLTLCNQGCYNIDDPLTIRQDSLAIQTRPDISSHIKKLAEEGAISHSLSDAKHNIALDLLPKNVVADFQEKFRQWATYIPISAAFVMEKFIKTDTEVEIQVLDTSSQFTEIVQFRPVWPSHIVYIHPCTSHGRRPLLLPVKAPHA
jgi:hypothetical protein